MPPVAWLPGHVIPVLDIQSASHCQHSGRAGVQLEIDSHMDDEDW